MLTAIAAVCVLGCNNEQAKFEAKVKASVNPDELQAWATNLISKESSQTGGIVVKQSDIPKWVSLVYKAEYDPGQVTIERGREGDFVQILYGGGFGHWGLAIGSPTLVLTNHDNVHNDLWKPGIYFWSSP